MKSYISPKFYIEVDGCITIKLSDLRNLNDLVVIGEYKCAVSVQSKYLSNGQLIRIDTNEFLKVQDLIDVYTNIYDINDPDVQREVMFETI